MSGPCGSHRISKKISQCSPWLGSLPHLGDDSGCDSSYVRRRLTTAKNKRVRHALNLMRGVGQQLTNSYYKTQLYAEVQICA